MIATIISAWLLLRLWFLGFDFRHLMWTLICCEAWLPAQLRWAESRRLVVPWGDSGMSRCGVRVLDRAPTAGLLYSLVNPSQTFQHHPTSPRFPFPCPSPLCPPALEITAKGRERGGFHPEAWVLAWATGRQKGCVWNWGSREGLAWEWKRQLWKALEAFGGVHLVFYPWWAWSFLGHPSFPAIELICDFL